MDFQDDTRTRAQANSFADELGALVRKHSPDMQAYVLCVAEGTRADLQLITISTLQLLGAAGLLTDALKHVLRDEANSRKTNHRSEGAPLQ